MLGRFPMGDSIGFLGDFANGFPFFCSWIAMLFDIVRESSSTALVHCCWVRFSLFGLTSNVRYLIWGFGVCRFLNRNFVVSEVGFVVGKMCSCLIRSFWNFAISSLYEHTQSSKMIVHKRAWRAYNTTWTNTIHLQIHIRTTCTHVIRNTTP